MIVLTDKDENIFHDYMRSYKECFEAMNDLLSEIIPRIELTEKEIQLSAISDAKYKNMVYHIRKWNPTFKKLNS